MGCLADHFVGACLRANVGECERLAAIESCPEVEALRMADEHSQRQHIHLSSSGHQIVLVPLDHGALRQGGVFHGTSSDSGPPR